MQVISSKDALAIIHREATARGQEIVSLAQSGGRVLAQDLAAKRTQPPIAVSAMDGFALRAADSSPLTIIGESSAGHAFDGKLKQGEAVQIHTGAPVPNGADAVVPIENVSVENHHLTLNAPVAAGEYVRVAGLDFKQGETLLKRGTRLDARSVGLAAAMNCLWLPVYRRIRAAVLASGDELVRPGEALGASQIISANHLALRAFLEARGVEVLDLPIARDNAADTGKAIESARGVDLLITIGGVSVGGRDLIRPQLEKLGFEILFHGVAVVPGKPLLFGRMDESLVMGLPGNPVSSLVAAEIFLAPLLAKLGGEEETNRPALSLPLAAPLPANGAREAYLRGKILSSGKVEAFSGQDSAQLALLAAADCLIVRPPQAVAAEKGERVEVLPLLSS